MLFDGHSHDTMTSGNSGEPIMQTGTKLANVGVVVIDEEKKKIERNFLYKVSDIETSGWSSKDVADLAEEIKVTVDDLYSQKVCDSLVDLNGARDKAEAEAQDPPFPNGNRDGETNFGDLSADSYRAEGLKMIETKDIPDSDADHVIGFINGGAIRKGIKKGDVTKEDILKAFPFSNTICAVYVDGGDLLEVMEASAFALPDENGGFPQISGMDYTVDTRYIYFPRKDPYPNSTYFGPQLIRRVTINSVNGKPFSPEETYVVMTNNYCATGGNACYLFSLAKFIDSGVTDVDSLVAYINDDLSGTIGTQYKDPEGRISIVTGPEKKSTNPMTVKVTNKTVKYKKAKKSAQKVKPFKVSKAAGKVTYKKTGGSARLTFNKKTGAVTVKKGTKKGTYKITVKFTASGDDYYNSKTKTVTAKIRVK